MANSHLTIFPSKGFSRTCCPRVRSEWRQAVDEEQKVRGGGEEGRFGSTVQPRASVPPLPPQSPATFYDPVFYDSTSCTRQACTHYIHHPVLTSDHKSLSRFCKTRSQLFCPFKKTHFLPPPTSYCLAVELQCVVYDPSVMTGGRQTLRTLEAHFRNLY